MRAAYSGPAGGLGERAARELLPDADLVPVDGDDRRLLADIEAGVYDAGVVPYEDSAAGTAAAVVDHLVFGADRLVVAAEVDLPVDGDPPSTRRFVVVSTTPAAPGPAAQTLLFVIPAFNRPGTLLEVLAAFSSRGLNLTKVESRPLGGRVGMYGFLIEFEGDPRDPEIREALGDVLHATSAMKYLGTFSAAGRVWGEVTGREPAGRLLHDLDDLDALVATLP